MNVGFVPGDEVVCIDAAWVPEHASPLIEGQVYVVEDIWPDDLHGEGDVFFVGQGVDTELSCSLYGVTHPDQYMFHETIGFDAGRFRKVETTWTPKTLVREKELT
jgi:hypothetical protein